MPSITEQSTWAEASHVILLISGSDYFRIKAEFMEKAHSHSDPGSLENYQQVCRLNEDGAPQPRK